MNTEIITIKNLTCGVSLEHVVAGKIAALFSDGSARDNVVVRHSVRRADGSHHALNVRQVRKIAQSMARKYYCGWGFIQLATAAITEGVIGNGTTNESAQNTDLV